MTSLTGPDLLASWLWRSIRDPGVPGSIPGRGTRREYFLYRSISPPTTHIQTSKSYHKIWIKKKKKKELTANQQRYGQPIYNVSVENIYGILGITDLSQERDMECGISLRIFCHFLSISVFLWAIGVAAVFDFRWNCLCCRRKMLENFIANCFYI